MTAMHCFPSKTFGYFGSQVRARQEFTAFLVDQGMAEVQSVKGQEDMAFFGT